MLLVAGDELQTNLVCGNETLKYSKQETLLGVTTDNKLIFATCLSLTRVQKYMTTDKKKNKTQIKQTEKNLSKSNR